MVLIIKETLLEVQHNSTQPKTRKMYKQNIMEDTKFYTDDLSDIEEFLLAHSSAIQAYINLSRIKEIIGKEELLEEIKRLIKEQIRTQIRKTQDFH